jgi:hypothetical protein
MGKRWKQAEKNLAKASKTAKKVMQGTKTILNALPTLNTEAVTESYQGNPFNTNNTETFFTRDTPTRKQNRHRRKLRPRKVVYY